MSFFTSLRRVVPLATVVLSALLGASIAKAGSVFISNLAASPSPGTVGSPITLDMTTSYLFYTNTGGGVTGSSFTIDWGDATSNLFSNDIPGSFETTHTYANTGVYTIGITGGYSYTDYNWEQTGSHYVLFQGYVADYGYVAYNGTGGINGSTSIEIDASANPSVSAVPLPASAWSGMSLLAGLGVCGIVRRRKLAILH